jgi:hypothetical protein
MRALVVCMADGQALAAAFDTRVNGVSLATGRASRGISRLLKRHGYRIVAAPESFLIGQQDTLLVGEASRARRWVPRSASSRATLTYPHDLSEQGEISE